MARCFRRSQQTFLLGSLMRGGALLPGGGFFSLFSEKNAFALFKPFSFFFWPLPRSLAFSQKKITMLPLCNKSFAQAASSLHCPGLSTAMMAGVVPPFLMKTDDEATRGVSLVEYGMRCCSRGWWLGTSLLYTPNCSSYCWFFSQLNCFGFLLDSFSSDECEHFQR
jgi:hypothetical protein